MRLSNPHRLLPCLLAASFLLPGIAGAQQQQADPASQPQTTTPKGTVLFERHNTPTPPAEEPPATPPQTGVSSSAHPPRLKRRSTDPQTQDAPQAPAQTAPEPEFSSSSTEPSAAPIAITPADLAAAAKIPAEAREQTAITARNLDMHLNSHTGATEIRALITVRNTGTAPLQTVALRVSGALHFESARLLWGGATTFEQHHLRDDLDHTGVATEAVLTLPEPMAPGTTAQLDVFYAGTFAASGSRLLKMGAPEEVAVRTDWDTVTDTFTGLRGVGNVLWYPVTGKPALLKDGAAVPNAVEASRAAEQDSSFSLRLTLEYEGMRPDAAFFCGDRKPLTAAAEEIATAEWTLPRLGPRTPSLFVTLAAPQEMAGGLVRVVTDEADRAAALGEAAARIRPMLEEWLGPKPSRPLDVIDLAVPDAAGFSEGALLVAPLRTAQPATIASSLVGPLAGAWLPDAVDAAWLRDGIPEFLQAVWVERNNGRAASLSGLAAEASRLRRMNMDATPQVSSSSTDVPATEAPVAPLATCTDAPCARLRTAYVLEMLRGMVGDSALQGALSGWRVKMEDTTLSAAEETAAFEKMVQQLAGPKKMDWFFQSWVNGTGSLPHLEIAAIAPRKIERGTAPANLLPQRQTPVAGPIGAEPVAPPDDPRNHWGGDKEIAQAGSWLVAVEVQNTGGTDAEVPVTVRAGTLTNTLRLRVPANGKATIRVPFEAEPEEVQVNDGSVPESGISLHRRPIAMAPAR